MIALRESLLLLLAGLIAFGGSVAGSFHLDDYALLGDPLITSPNGWWQVWAAAYTRPLTWFTFWANYQLGGAASWGYHLVNLLVHLACVLLFRDALRRAVPAGVALTAAALFAVHPIVAEPVVYVFSRSILLAALFCLLALRSWFEGRPWRAAAWFVPALLAKEECAAFPVFLLALHWSAARQRRELAPIAAMTALAIAAGLRVAYGTRVVAGSGSGFAAGVSPLDYFATQGLVILRYLKLVFIPWGFTVDPDVGVVKDSRAWLAWGVLALLGLGALRWFTRARAGFWIVGGLLLLAPSSSVFPAADLAADRRMYLPFAAFSVAIALALCRLDRRFTISMVSVLAILSAARTGTWRTEESLWTEAVERAPRKLRPRIQLARAAAPERALAILEEAEKIAPGDPQVPSEKGRVYLLLGRAGDALGEFGRALALRPRDPKAINNRGAALLALGQGEAARADFERALTLDPCLADARENLRRMGVELQPPGNCREARIKEP